jgi:dipeptide/tripeptide permease
MLMIVVYSGFWILYFQNFGSVLWYLRDFVDVAPVNAFFAGIGIPLKFDAEHVTVVNGGTIILLQVLVSRLVKNVRPLPTMVTGIVIGTLGFLCLAASTNVWVFILGISVFSIGEMTAHPKYYSYVGLVAPADKKAVYMGYAFLYGVIGSLIGSSLGGFMYGAMLKPVIGQPGAQAVARLFWLIFVALNILAAVGLVFYDRIFAEDTPATNEKARRVMLGIYLLLLLAGVGFLYASVFGGSGISYKIMVQATILLLLGASGTAVSLRKR